MPKVVISGYYGFKNFGDETILSVLINHLKSIGINDITVFSSDTKFTSETYSVNSVRSFDIKNVIKTLQSADVLISGGGSLLQDVTSLKSLVYYVMIIALAILFNKKVIIFAQGIGPIKNKFACLIVKKLLKFASVVTVRDEKSFKLMEDWKIPAKLVCDPVYSLKLEHRNLKGKIGVQLRDFPTMNYNLLQKLAQMIAKEFSEYEIKILSLQNSIDLKICEKFKEILYTINPQINAEVVNDNLLEYITSLEYLVAMRFHAILTAILCGVKTCAINYDIKVEQLAKNAGLPIISMDGNENFFEISQQMQNLTSEKLIRFAEKNNFDWKDIDDLLIFSK